MNDELKKTGRLIPERQTKGESISTELALKPTGETRIPNPESRARFARRDLLKVITAAPAALVTIKTPAAQKISSVASQMIQPAVPSPGAIATAYQPKLLTEHEYITIRILSDWIIPADDRSGSATEAGVHQFIDDWLDFRGGRERDCIRGGITWLDLECNRQYNQDFLACSRDQQKHILDRIAYPKRAALEDTAAVAFFNQLRDLVVSGFFSSKMGLEDLPYLGNQVLPEWEGCPAEVMAKIQENENKREVK